MKKLIFLILVFSAQIVFPQPKFGKTGIISGTVSDKNGNPLQYVSVQIYDFKDSLINGTLTDEQGKFFFKDIPFGKYKLISKFVGFNKRIDTIVLSPQNRFVQKNITIVQTEKNIEKVVITGEVANVEYKIDKKVVRVSKELSARGGSAVDVLRNVPSVQVDVEGNVTLRGSSNFQVLINGRPTILEGNEALQQIPASSIEKIEIITNPSAKYDPDGVAGIINIITKKNAQNGFSGKVELSADNFLGYNVDVLLDYKKEKFEVFAEFNIRNRVRKIKIQQNRTIDSTYTWSSDGNMLFSRQGIWGKTGFSLFPNEKNTISTNFEFGKRAFNHNSFTQITENNTSKIDTTTATLGGLSGKAELNYEHKFNENGHKLSSFVQVSFWQPEKINLLTEVSSSDIYKEKTIENRFNRKLRFQTDYELPINNGKFEAGFVVRLMNLYQDFSLFYYDNQWIENTSYKNQLDFFRNIYGGYFTFSKSTKIIDFKLGLRSEYTDRTIQDIKENSYSYKKLDFFPTLHLSKQFPNNHQIQLSYSRRINRPKGWILNPSLMYVDKYTFQKGNPDLKPEYTNSFEFNYLKKFKKRSSFSVETYFRQTFGRFDRIQQIDSSQRIIFTWANINKDYSLGAEVSTNLFIKFFMLNVSADAYYYEIFGELDGDQINKQTFTFNSRFMIMTFIPFVGGFQLGGFYSAPTITLQGKRKAMFFTYLGISKSFFKKKLQISFSSFDIFNTGKFQLITETDNLYSTSVFDPLTSFRFTITYRINNYKSERKKNFQQNNADETEGFIGF